MRKKSFLTILFNTLLIAGCSFLVYKLFDGFQSLSTSEKSYGTKSLESKDSVLLSDFLLKNGKVVLVRKNKIQNSFLHLFVDNKYNVFAYRINIDSFAGKLSPIIIQTEREKIDRTVGVVYNIVETKDFKLSFKAGLQSAISKIILTHSNHMNNWQGTDSTFVLNGFTNDFSVRYGQNEDVDLYFEKNELTNVPMSLIFRVRKGKLVFYLITTEGEEYNIPGQLIKNIIGE